MNRDKLEQWILLRQSGELGRVRGFLLDRALARDPELRRYADDSARIMSAARAWSVAQPGAHTAEAIHARINEAPDRREDIIIRAEPAFRLWPILAGVTALLLAVALITLKAPERVDSVARTPAAPHDVQAPLAWEDHVDAELDALMELVSLNGTDESARPGAPTTDEESLVRELLALEGIAI